MAVCKCTGEHVDSPQDSQLMELLGDYRGYDGGLIPVLQGAQEIYGYLPSSCKREYLLIRNANIPQIAK